MSVGTSNNYMNIQENPTFCGSRTKKWAKKEQKFLKYIELTPNSPVSDTFEKEMIQGIKFVDESVLKQVAKDGNLKMKLAQKATDAFPDLDKSFVFADGRTWDECPSISRGTGLTGYFEKPLGYNHPKPSSNHVVHEIGHELDKLFIKIFGDRFVNTKGFTEVYLKDIAKLPENLKKYSKKITAETSDRLDYLIQGSTPRNITKRGKIEAFAEIFAMLNGGSAQEARLKGIDKLYKKVFPNTTAYIEKLLRLLGKR
ncbi:MAG TPA: hypothetical protein DDW90_10375 [Cyanobacteria bacterium UBA9971]|nr:hypothetical protein [Cyanobacteria bacterium UBA9971]